MYVALDDNGAEARETFHCISHICNCSVADFKIKLVYFKKEID